MITSPVGRGDPASSIWLDMKEVEGLPVREPTKMHFYELELIGREPICDRDSIGHGFGHMNISDRLIVVERLLSIKKLAHWP